MAGELAAQRSAAALILESSFPSIETVAKVYYGGFPAHWFLGAELRLVDRLPHLSLPKLIIHGEKDDIIPVELGRQVLIQRNHQGMVWYSKVPIITIPIDGWDRLLPSTWGIHSSRHLPSTEPIKV